MNRQAISKARAERGLPSGAARMPVFASQLRATLVQRDGKNFYEVEGYATVFNKPYQMYDMFGEYTEQVASTALDESLSRSPDVAFLLNHRGMTMARTTNGTLELSKDVNGLRSHAFLNADRQDVRDLASAINDGLVDEMSFAFMIGSDGYSWNDDYSALTLTRIDINRGDVSAVNYGANPFTSIGARAADVLREIRELPAGALPAAQRALTEALGSAYAAYGEARADLYRSAAREAAKAARLRMAAMRDAGMTPDQIKAEFPDLDFSDWKIVDETGDDAEPETSAERSADVPKENGKSVSLQYKRFQALDA